MGFNVCPATVVAAPVDVVWDLLSDPTRYDEWWNAYMERIEPAGKATPGQVLSAKTSALGMTGHMTIHVEAVDSDPHQIRLQVALPFGILNNASITCTPLDATSSYLQFG